MNVAVWPIHQAAGVERCVVSTYQAASGAGAAAMDELEQQGKDYAAGKPIEYNIWKGQYIYNLFSHNADIDMENGYNEEEIKMIRETRKIFRDDDIAVTATCIRVPVLRAHCEAINLTLRYNSCRLGLFLTRVCRNPLTEAEVRKLLENAPGVKIVDDRAGNQFPEPILASGVASRCQANVN